MIFISFNDLYYYLKQIYIFVSLLVKSKFKMGATQSNSTFVDIKEGTTKIKQYFDDGTFEFIEIDCLIITTSGGI